MRASLARRSSISAHAAIAFALSTEIRAPMNNLGIDHLVEQFQRPPARERAVLIARAREVDLLGLGAGRGGEGEPDEADRLVGRAAGGAGDAGDRDRDVDAETRARAFGHPARALLPDRAVRLERPRRYPD